jgi:hypothetical protein
LSPTGSVSTGGRGATVSGGGPTTTSSTSLPRTAAPAASSTKMPAPEGTGGSGGGEVRSSPKIVDASPAAAKQPSAGSPLPFLLGALVVSALLGGATAVALRRRREMQAQEE